MQSEKRSFYSRFGAKKVTPNQIYANLYSDKSFSDQIGESFEDLWKALPPKLMLEFTSNTGRLKEKKIDKFMRSLDLLFGEYKLMDLVKMDADCIRNDGSIDINRLEAILRGECDD